MPLLDRRAFLRIAAGAGLALHRRPLLALWGARRKVRGVLWLWMDGGMCPVHTWDPKPDTSFGCRVKAIPTTVPGIEVSEWLPICASQMKHLTIIRTLSHGLGDLDMATNVMHVGAMIGESNDLAPIGTILAHELGPKEFPLPKYVSIGGPPIPERTGFGQECVPFRINGTSPFNPIPNIRRNVDATRDRERAQLLFEQNKEWDALRQQPEVERLESAYLRSEAMMNTPLLKAFNFQEEPEALRTEYGEGFGQQCLLGRRLLQAGCPFVEIGFEGWRQIFCRSETYRQRVKTLDQGLGTLIKDLVQKDLLAETLVVCASPFGRFSRPVKGDAWVHAYSVVLAGGCLPGGMVFGDTGPHADRCNPPVPVKDLFATILCICGVDWDKEYRTEANPKRKYASGGWPVEEVF
jgi:hypothetical protein